MSVQTSFESWRSNLHPLSGRKIPTPSNTEFDMEESLSVLQEQEDSTAKSGASGGVQIAHFASVIGNKIATDVQEHRVIVRFYRIFGVKVQCS